MALTLLLQLFIFSYAICTNIAMAALSTSLRHPPSVSNKVVKVDFACDSRTFNVTLSMESPFKGAVFAKDFVKDCKAYGKTGIGNQVKLVMPTSGCGVRLSTYPDGSGKVSMSYSVNLVVQQDRFLRQIIDQEKNIKCSLNEDAFLVRSEAIAGSFQDGKVNHRVGRMKDAGWSKELEGKQFEEELKEALAASKAWMEISPEQNKDNSGRLQVGETAILRVKTTLPAGIGWKVVNCTAHDGLGDSSQKLLDEFGCSIDDVLVPHPIYGPIRVISLMRHQEAVSRFPAFKFPDRDRLHFTCSLEFCKGPCPKANCTVSTSPDLRKGKSFTSENDTEILDRIEIYNSVEVLSPEIEDVKKSDIVAKKEPKSIPFTNSLGDRTFCMSPEKMAILFSVLGLIFLGALIVAVYSLMRSSRWDDSTMGSSYSCRTRSLFSSSFSSGGGAGSTFDSKLLLTESPRLGTPSRYGRIL